MPKIPCAFVMRHGDTELNEDNCFRGFLNPGLNDKGILQASKAGEFLSRQQIDRVISSPLCRTIETSQIVAAKLGGRHIKECHSLFPWAIAPLYGRDKDKYSEVLDWYIDQPDKIPENGESLNDFLERTEDYFCEKLQECIPTLFVCHTSNIVALNDLIMGTEGGRPEQGEVVEPGGICAIYEEKDGWSIEPVFGQVKKAEFGS